MSFEHTRSYGGSIDEKKLAQLHVVLGRLQLYLSVVDCAFVKTHQKSPMKYYYSPADEFLATTKSILKCQGCDNPEEE